ncbi:MAG: helix-turn-helix transcriptional regulator [Fibrobacteres bacterium]|nr:helix-turn-helix transcriptional regulator [Fibrobacterota bacterium]
MHKRLSTNLPPYWFHVDYPVDFPVMCEHDRMSPRKSRTFHIHNGLELGLCQFGKGTFVIEEKAFNFSAGDVFIISNLEAHYALAREDSKWIWVYFEPIDLFGAIAEEPELLKTDAYAGAKFGNRIPKGTVPVLGQLILEIIDEWDNKQEFHRDRIKSLLLHFLIELRRLFVNKPIKFSPAPRKAPSIIYRLKPALDAMRLRFHESLKIDALSRECNMSSVYFRTLFGETFNKSPLKYLNEYRITIACKLLTNTDEKILTIATDCGFPTLSSFNRQFWQLTGRTPREWRKMNGNSRLELLKRVKNTASNSYYS